MRRRRPAAARLLGDADAPRAVFFIIITAFNFIGVGAFGEAEFWCVDLFLPGRLLFAHSRLTSTFSRRFSLIKIITLVGLILLGIIITSGGVPGADPIGFRCASLSLPFLAPAERLLTPRTPRRLARDALPAAQRHPRRQGPLPVRLPLSFFLPPPSSSRPLDDHLHPLSGLVGPPKRLLTHVDPRSSFWTVFLQASFSFLGTEIVALTAAEAENPRRNVPKAINRVFYRILFLYVLLPLTRGPSEARRELRRTSLARTDLGAVKMLELTPLSSNSYVVGVFVMSLLVSPNDDRLINGGSDAAASPWVIGIQRAGIKALPSIVNAVILIAAFSAGNSDLYAASRTLYGLACDGQAPRIFAKTTANGLPIWSLVITALFGVLAYMNLGTTGEEAFNYLVAIGSVSGLINWFVLSRAPLSFSAVSLAEADALYVTQARHPRHVPAVLLRPQAPGHRPQRVPLPGAAPALRLVLRRLHDERHHHLQLVPGLPQRQLGHWHVHHRCVLFISLPPSSFLLSLLSLESFT